MKDLYLKSVAFLERAHKTFSDLISMELDSSGYNDITNVQALILYNIGVSQISVGELTQRGYYLGSNVSYNLRKMLLNGYINQTQSEHDKRSVYVNSSEKGLELYRKIDEIFSKHSENIAEILKNEELSNLCMSLQKVENFWRNIPSIKL